MWKILESESAWLCGRFWKGKLCGYGKVRQREVCVDGSAEAAWLCGSRAVWTWRT
jgi:hypothetical protein